jgi:OmcA/MtrC family decaheme c-type cytochrome
MRWILLSIVLVACEGPAGPRGAAGPNGGQDANGPAGDGGQPLAPWLTQPGVAILVTGTTFASGHATISFTVTDGSGAGLDLLGRLTEGTVAASFVVSQLAVEADGTPGQYTAYTTAQVTGGAGAVATQPITESSGVFTVVDVVTGEYSYAVAAPLTGLDPTLTQTVGALAVRTVGGVRAIARDTYSVRPDGGATIAREVVTDSTCDSCHQALDAHGGRWISPRQCVLCHQPQNTDPTSGNTLDFKVMVHKLHRGSSLPSVVAGTPYQIIGFMQSVNDFSTVVFPQDIARCTACHNGAQGDRWETAPSKLACTSCHDTTSFASPVPVGMVLHGGGTQPDNAMCAVCHPSTGSLAGIADKHLTGLLAANAPTVAVTIQSMTNTAPGQTPTMRFTVLVNGAPADLIGSPLTGMTATIAGPTTDYASEWQAKIQGAGAIGTLSAVDAATGVYSYAFPATAAIPAAATGSYSVSVEAYLQPTPADPRFAAVNPVLTFAVTDATPEPRRTIVSLANCDGCHYRLAAHGGARTNPQYCVFCHNTTGADTAGAPRFEGTTNVLADTIDFRHFIHKIHAGDQLSEPYVIGGFPLPTVANPGGTPNDFGAVRYPRALTDCAACHTSKNWILPLSASPAYAPSTSALMGCAAAAGSDTSLYCAAPFWTVTQTILTQPTASVCTSCHDGPAVAAHAQLNTTPAGAEACATCHGPGAVEDVGVLHGFP